MGIFHYDFDKAKIQVRQLNEVADEMDNLIKNQYMDTLQILAGAWKGDSASLFLKKGAKLQEAMEKTAKSMEETAEAYEKIIQSTWEMEERIKEIAKLRSYT